MSFALYLSIFVVLLAVKGALESVENFNVSLSSKLQMSFLVGVISILVLIVFYRGM